MKEFGCADIGFLSEDGECISFVVVGEPVLLEGKYKGQPTEKIGCPVVTIDGFQLLVIGKRLARRLSKYEDRFKDIGFFVVRHGGRDDASTQYELSELGDNELTVKLLKSVKLVCTQEMIDEAILAAYDIMKD